MKTQTNTTNTLGISVFLLASTLLFISCSGCRSSKVAKSLDTSLPDKVSDTEQVVTQADTTQISSTNENNTDTYKQPEVHLQRQYLGKDIDLTLNPEHRGGDGWNAVWEEDLDYNGMRRLNRIVQLSPTVLLYRRFPEEAAKNFYYLDQPEKIEFLDTSYHTIKVVDIWKDRPYQDVKNAKLTYWNFDSEDMGVIPYTEQQTPINPNEYSLFTHVQSEGNHVIVNYELRSIKNSKQWGMEASDVVAVKHMLHIYDLQGNLKYVLKDLPSIDQAVVSNDGKYMMYIFGGMNLATANSPFGTIERPGWALMRLEDRKVVYQEYTDDGILAFAVLIMTQDLIMVAYSTPSTEVDYDYWVFFDDNTNSIYIHKLTAAERKIMNEDYNSSNGKFLYKNYFHKFNFEQIEIGEK